jgi:hypothetical protein
MELHEMYAEIQKSLGIVLTPKELSKELKINYVDALKLMKTDGFPVVQIGERKSVVPRKELIEWLSNKLN